MEWENFQLPSDSPPAYSESIHNHEQHPAVHEEASECSINKDCHRKDLADLLGKKSAKLLADWLNLTPTNAPAECDRNQNETVDEEAIDLELLEEGDFDCQGEPLEECTMDQD
ncbi:MAG TPA: hypothetical protein VGK20_08610 [Candidatus Binatia bacterium]